MTPAYVKEHKLKVGPVHELALHPTAIPISDIGGHTAALGYVIVNIQVEGIPSYYKEKVALVIPGVTHLGMKVPVILGTPTIHHLCHQMKELEIRTAPEEWQHALLSYEVAQNVSIHAMALDPGLDEEIEYPMNAGQNPLDLDETGSTEGQSYHPCIRIADSAYSDPENIHERSPSECHGTTAVSGG